MRKLTLPGIVLAPFALMAAMAALGPLRFGGGKAGLYHWLQTTIDATLVARFGRGASAAMALGLGLLLAGAVIALAGARRAAKAAAPASPGDQPDPAETEAQALEAAERRLAAMRQRSQEESDPAATRFAEPQPVLVVRTPRAGGRGAAHSWFGGEPRLGSQPWPADRRTGQPLPFAAQIDLAELAALRPGTGLPESGSLAFFLGEGAVIHVPPAPDGAPHPRTPPPADAPAVLDGEELFPTQPGPDARKTWRWWPVALHPLDLPDALPDRRSCTDEEAEAIDRAQMEAAARFAPHREVLLSAPWLCEELGIQPVPLWWHSVGLFAAQLRKAWFHSDLLLAEARGRQADAEARLAELQAAGEAADSEAVERQQRTIQRQQGRVELVEQQREKLPAAIDAIDWFRADRPEWAVLEPGERDDFLTLHGEIREHCGELARHHTSEDPLELATASIRAAMTGPDEAFAALPAALRTAVDEGYRHPAGAIQQIFGLGLSLHGAAWDHVDDVLLLQLAHDDMMDWRFGEVGLFQFWIDPRDAALGRWDRATLTFECT